MTVEQLQGIWTALPTPFREGAIDKEALIALVEEQIQAGVHGLVPCGTTGESATLRDDEHRCVVECVVAQSNGRVPVFAGAGAAATEHSVILGRQAKDAGADGLLLVCPYYNRPTQRGLEAHARRVTAEVGLPVLLYNVPSRTGSDISIETLECLQDEPLIWGLKDASGDIRRISTLRQACGDRFAIFGGDDALSLPALALGAKGIISVTANVLPAPMIELWQLMRESKLEQALSLHERLLPVHQALFAETNPGPLKMALSLRRNLAPELRLPLFWPSKTVETQLRNALQSWS